MISKIKKELDNYLEFNSNILFNSNDYIVVFGGALRDIIANDSDKIKDIDIMCLPKSRNRATKILLSEGYKLLYLFSPDLFCLYRDIKCIFEPKTFIKGDKIVQLITPTTNNIINFNLSEIEISITLQKNFFTVLKNVDLSSSGLIYNGKQLYESVKSSVFLIKNKKFFTIENALMYNDKRIFIRKNNLFDKDWLEINMGEIDLILERGLKLSTILDNFPFIDELEKSMITFNNQKNSLL